MESSIINRCTLVCMYYHATILLNIVFVHFLSQNMSSQTKFTVNAVSINFVLDRVKHLLLLSFGIMHLTDI